VLEVVKEVRGVMSSEQAVAQGVAELEAQGHRNARHVRHDKHPDGVRHGRNTWVIQFDVMTT
jgi:hypothetical protein